jgi:ribosomal protein L9
MHKQWCFKTIEIKIVAKAGGEKLFGSITNIDIAAVLAKGGQVIDRKFITSGIVKRTGKYSASVRLHRDVIINCLTKLQKNNIWLNFVINILKSLLGWFFF